MVPKNVSAPPPSLPVVWQTFGHKTGFSYTFLAFFWYSVWKRLPIFDLDTVCRSFSRLVEVGDHMRRMKQGRRRLNVAIGDGMPGLNIAFFCSLCTTVCAKQFRVNVLFKFYVQSANTRIILWSWLAEVNREFCYCMVCTVRSVNVWLVHVVG
jgi:hypothetical protein